MWMGGVICQRGGCADIQRFLTAHHIFYMEARGLHVPDLMPLHQEKTHALCTPPSVVGYPLRTQSCILVSSDRILHLGYLSPTGA